jgi:conjugal transfer pilus assembly protein TraB
MIDIQKFDRKKLFKSKAVVVGGIIIITILSSIGVYSGMKAKSIKQEEVEDKEKGVDIKIRPTKEVVSTETLWRDAILAKINDLDRKQGESLSKESLQLKLSIEELKEKQKEQQKSDGDLALINKVSNLARELTELKSKNNLMIKEGVASKSNDISQYNLNLENAQNSEEYKPLKTTDNYIPAGSFAKAVLLSGVDAETSLDAEANPSPIVIRIIDHGTLPRKFKSDIKDCHVIGAVYGHLSSERVKIRVEKLSCVEIATAEVIETQIVGFVAGEDGREGIRGEVVSTEGRLLGNSFLAGVLGGFANSFNPNTGPQPSIILSDKPQKQSVRNKLGDGFATGTVSSMDRLAKHYIDRAESLQPIIQVGAGRKVDVMFTEGVFFGNSEIKKAISKKRDESIRNELGSASSGMGDSSVIQPLN